MIREIKIPGCNTKKNWIDQNNIVFGYSDHQHCCEAFGWGVFNSETKERVAFSPDGLSYHFDFEKGAVEIEGNPDPLTLKDGDGYEIAPSCPDTVQVELVSDTDETKRLVFECWNVHNGYYYHDFSFERNKKDKK